MDDIRPKVGVGVHIVHDGKLLLHKRKGEHGGGLWGGPGGHLELGESFEDCVRRETKEEAGIELGEIKLLCVTNLKFPDGKHYVDLGFLAEWKSGEPKVLEPHKNEGWRWFDINNLPGEDELFGCTSFYKETYLSGKYPAFRDA